MSQQNNSTKYAKTHNLTCQECNISFQSIRKTKYCNDTCRKIGSAKEETEKRRLKTLLKFPDGSDPDSYVECKICGWRTADLSAHPGTHGISQEDYKNNYGPIKCKNISIKMSGANNPGYQHGGKLSPFSKNFVNFKSEEDIQERFKKSVDTRNANCNNTCRLDYYTSKGATLEEAKKMLSERQSTFSLEKCIKKYGLEEGTIIHRNRQAKWQYTLMSKPLEEQYLINLKKLYRGGKRSKQEIKLFNSLCELTGLDLKSQYIIKRTDLTTRYYSYDIYYEGKIIEYNGNFWHANPNKYAPTDIHKFPGNTGTAEDRWKKDKLKSDMAVSNGNEIIVVWEYDFTKFREQTIQRCIDFLQS